MGVIIIYASTQAYRSAIHQFTTLLTLLESLWSSRQPSQPGSPQVANPACTAFLTPPKRALTKIPTGLQLSCSHLPLEQQNQRSHTERNQVGYTHLSTHCFYVNMANGRFEQPRKQQFYQSSLSRGRQSTLDQDLRLGVLCILPHSVHYGFSPPQEPPALRAASVLTSVPKATLHEAVW